MKFVLCRAVLIIIDPSLDNQLDDLAGKSEGAHTVSVLFEFTEKRCMNEASAIWDLKGFIATITVPCAPKDEFSAKSICGSLLASGHGTNNNGASSARTIWLRRSVLGSATIPPGSFPRSQACLWTGGTMTRQSPHVREQAALNTCRCH
ncbi:hypothetical protein ACVWW4_003869 [Bradyrhizobium sp. LB7.1]